MQQAYIDNWSELSRHRGYSSAFIEQAKQAKARAVVAEMREAGLSKFRRSGMPQWAREILLEVSDRTGVCTTDLGRDARFKRIVKARNEVIYRIKAHKPLLSCVLIAKWFNRDHTSILHGIASHQEANNLPKLVGYNITRVRQRNMQSRADARSGAEK